MARNGIREKRKLLGDNKKFKVFKFGSTFIFFMF